MTKFWTDLHQAICSTLKEEISAIQTCEIYPSIRKELLAPAVFVELVSLESGKDPGTEELALKARFEARIRLLSKFMYGAQNCELQQSN